MPIPIQNVSTSELPLITTSIFAATTPENTPLAYRASTLANPIPMIKPAVIEANYEILKSLLRERQKQIRNEDLRTELGYFSEEYDEEREMEPRPEKNRETTLPLCTRSPRVRRQRERVVGFEEATSREGGRIERNVEGSRPSELRERENGSRGMNLPPLLAAHLGRSENGQALQSSLTFVYRGHQPSTNIGGNLPPNNTHLSHHAQSFIPSSLHPSNGFIPTYVNSYSQPFTDHGHDTNDCRQLRNQIEESVKLGQLSHLVKGIKKERTKAPDTQRGEGKKDNGTVNRVYMDIGSSCEVIYEHCFLKLKPSIKASKVDSKVPLVGFSREHSLPIREVLLEITIGDAPFSRTETLNFVIVRFNSPHNLLLGRTAMQKIGIVVSAIHGAIIFRTAQGISTVFSMYESNKVREVLKKIKEASPVDLQGILSCTNAKERVIINDKHLEQTIIIRKQLPENFKEKLRNLLNMATCKEVEELMKARILRRVKNQMWVAYLVMVKKSDGGISKEDMLKDIPETFEKFRSINMKLNPKKCSFGVEEGPFLGHHITKQERNNTKKEVPKDFLVELPFKEDKKKVAGTTETKLEGTKLSKAWKLYTDGASSSDGSGAGLMLINPEGKEYTYALGFEFETMKQSMRHY
ncbi:hypothetical protein Tco_0956623 [Tanacetum coccineum]